MEGRRGRWRKTAIYGAFKGAGKRKKKGKIGEDDGEGEEEKSLTGDTSKALITAYFLFLSGKIKICIQEKLVLQEHSIVFLSPFHCRMHMPVIFAVFVNY